MQSLEEMGGNYPFLGNHTSYMAEYNWRSLFIKVLSVTGDTM